MLQGLDAVGDGEGPANIPGTEAVGMLQASVDASMGKGMVDVRPDDGIAAGRGRRQRLHQGQGGPHVLPA